jgi:hypothetical protein
LRNQHNIVGLEKRQLNRVTDDLRVLMVEESDALELAIYYDALAWLLIDSAIRAHRFLKSDVVSAYETTQGIAHVSVFCSEGRRATNEFYRKLMFELSATNVYQC